MLVPPGVSQQALFSPFYLGVIALAGTVL